MANEKPVEEKSTPIVLNRDNYKIIAQFKLDNDLNSMDTAISIILEKAGLKK